MKSFHFIPQGTVFMTCLVVTSQIVLGLDEYVEVILPPPTWMFDHGSNYQIAMQIDEAGTIDGYSLVEAQFVRWENGQVFPVGSYGGGHDHGRPTPDYWLWAKKTNSAGQSIGYENDLGGVYGHGRPYFFDGAVRHYLDSGNEFESPTGVTIHGLNEHGQVVGNSLTGDNEGAFIWQDGTFTFLGFLSTAATTTPSSVGLGINDLGQVVGWSRVSNGAHQAFIWEDGAMYPLGRPADVRYFSTAISINNSGDLVGYVQHGSSGSTVAILWDAILPGDFNNDKTVDASDIDLLRSAIFANDLDSLFNVNGDSLVNAADMDYLIQEIIGTEYGDANLNGTVNFDDFVRLANNFMGTDTGWAAGNLNLDFNTDFIDFVILSNNFGTVTTPVPVVPEPCSAMFLGLAVLARHRRLAPLPPRSG